LINSKWLSKNVEVSEKSSKLVIPAKAGIYFTNKNTGFPWSPLSRGWEWQNGEFFNDWQDKGAGFPCSPLSRGWEWQNGEFFNSLVLDI